MATKKVTRQAVSMRLLPKTISKIEELSEKLDAPSKGQMVASSIALVDELIREMEGGSRVLIEKDGITREIRFSPFA